VGTRSHVSPPWPTYINKGRVHQSLPSWGKVGGNAFPRNPHQVVVGGTGCTRSCPIGELGGNAFPRNPSLSKPNEKVEVHQAPPCWETGWERIPT